MSRMTVAERRRAEPWVAITAIVYTFLCGRHAWARESMMCPKAPPIGNAYRKWNATQETMTYSCLETYTLMTCDEARTCSPAQREVVRTWNSSTQTFSGPSPVCRLDCGNPRNETGSTVAYSSTLSRDMAQYQCSEGFIAGNLVPNITCSDSLGMWSHSNLNCFKNPGRVDQRTTTVTIITPLNESYDIPAKARPQPTSGDDYGPDKAVDRNPETYVTLSDGAVWSVKLSRDGSWVEVVRVELTLKLSANETSYPCRLTSAGLEYAGSVSESASETPCQRWDMCESCNYTNDDFPTDGSVKDAANFCRNPYKGDAGMTNPQPWCLTAGDTPENCSLPVCVKLSVRTIYDDADSRPHPNKCTADPTAVLDAVNQTVQITVSCVRTKYRTAFGYALQVTADILVPSISLQLHNVDVYGRNYTGGCGRSLGYWGLESVNGTNTSVLYTEVWYRCRDDWHHLGGPLVSRCLEYRQWSQPDLSQCTDLPNMAETAWYLNNEGNAVKRKGDGCYEVTSLNSTLTVQLNRTVEVADVVVCTTDMYTVRTDIAMDVEILHASGSWRCENVTPSLPTAHFSCPQRPFGQRVRVRFREPTTNGTGFNLTVCAVKVFGRDSVSAVECLQTQEGYDYKGHMNVTVSGKNCKSWREVPSSKHLYTNASLFPDADWNSVANNCRNPYGNTPREKPWCYTTDPRVDWEYCPLFPCNDICRLREDGARYTGEISFSRSGNSCQKWLNDKGSGYDLSFQRDHYFIDASPTGPAKCRNPIASQTVPWCYTNNGDVRTEHCDIPTCPVVGELEMVVMGPIFKEASLPDYFLDSDVWQKKVRECFQWPQNAFLDQSRHERSDKFTRPIPKPCSSHHTGIGLLCNSVDDKKTRWGYFWFNCSAPSDSGSCSCPCTPLTRTPDASSDITHKLLVDKAQLSATVRKKTCARDDRPSAIATGTFGIVILVVTICVLVIGDVIAVFRYFLSCLKSTARKSSQPPLNR